MFGAMLKVTNSSFKKGMTFCCSIYGKKGIKLLAFLFEQKRPTLSDVWLYPQVDIVDI